MPQTKKVKPDTDTQKPSVAVAADAIQTEENAQPSVPKRKTKDSIEKAALIQYGSGEWSVADLEEKVIAAYVAEGHRRGRISKLTVYIKPEEKKIYYVINDKITGSTEFEYIAEHRAVMGMNRSVFYCFKRYLNMSRSPEKLHFVPDHPLHCFDFIGDQSHHGLDASGKTRLNPELAGFVNIGEDIHLADTLLNGGAEVIVCQSAAAVEHQRKAGAGGDRLDAVKIQLGRKLVVAVGIPHRNR